MRSFQVNDNVVGQKPYAHPTASSDYYIRPVVLQDRDMGAISAFDKRITVLDRQLTRQKVAKESTLDRTRDIEIVKALDAWAPKKDAAVTEKKK